MMSGCRVYLGRLPYRTRERDVEKCFRPFGYIRDIHLKDGFGFIVSADHFHKLYSQLLK